jgi:Zn-dependent protease
MPAGGGLTLFHVRGIRISVDYSWFFVLFLIILWLSGYYRDVLDTSSDATDPYVLAVASALLFFGSILLHELGHAMVAVRNGIRITDITLWMFGGVARMSRDSDTPGMEFRIAIAGPMVTLAIVIVGLAVGTLFAGVDEFYKAMRVEDTADTSGALAVVAWLTSINFLILIFNLIPAYPLDGGRIARAAAWWRSGDRTGATRLAANLGRGFSFILIGAGAYLLIQGDPIGGIWLGAIGFILYQSARSTELQTRVTSRIEGVTVADVMDREPVAIPDVLSVEQALDEYFLRYRWPWFPVVDAAQRFRGLLQRDTADAVPEMRRNSATVAEVLEADRGGQLRVRDDEPLEALLGNENLRRHGALMAVDADGRLSGVVTIDQVGRALRTALSGSGGDGR